MAISSDQTWIWRVTCRSHGQAAAAVAVAGRKSLCVPHAGRVPCSQHCTGITGSPTGSRTEWDQQTTRKAKSNGGLEPWNFMTFHSVGNGMSSSQLTNSIIFPKGRYTTHQKVSWEGLNPFGPSISSARSKKMVDLCTPRRRLQVSATGLLVFSLVRPKPGEALQF